MRLDTTFLVGVWLEALFYGVYVAAFLVCLGLFRSRAQSVGRALPIWLVVLFVLATAHCALSLSAALDAFVRQIYPAPFPYPPAPSPSPSAHPSPNGAPIPMPGPPNPSSSAMPPRAFRDPVFYISNRALPTNLASLGVYAGIVLVSDLMLLYPVSMVVVTKYSHIDLTLSKDAILAELETVDPWVPPVYAISFLASLSIAALMMVRTSFTSSPKSTLPAFARAGRRHTRQTSLTAGDGFVFDMDERTGPVPSLPSNSGPPSESGVRRSTISRKWVMLAGLVESGAIAPVFMLAALILYVVQGGQETLLVPLLAPIAALVPTLQIIQIQLGLDSSARSSSPTTSNNAASLRTGAEAGRSPYLVPAPRYRDSFSSSEDEGQDRKVDLLDRNPSGRGRAQTVGARPETGARRWSARGVWAWRGSGSGSGSHGSGSGSRSHARSLSGTGSNGSASNNRADPIVALPMQDLSSTSRPPPTQAHNKDDTIWERIKLDSDPSPSLTPKPTPAPTSPPKRNTLRKSGTVMKEMISKPVPVAADFPPTTAAIPSTTVPALPSFTVTSPGPSQGGLAKVPSLSRMASGNLGRKTSGGLDRKTSGNLGRTASGKDKDKDKDKEKDGGEHKYHYRMRPRERTTSHLAAYLSAQAREQEGNSSSGHLPPAMSSSGHPGSNVGHPGPGSNSGHANLMSLPSTVPTSPASGFTSLAPNTNPFRYDAATPPPLQLPPQSQPQPQPPFQSQHKRSYSDVQRGDAPSPQPGVAGIGLSGAHRTPLTFPFAPDPEVGNVPRWGVLPGAPYIPGLGGGMRKVERDVSPAPGLQQDYARAREEVLRQMQRERGAMSDDESVYSTQPLSAVGSGWRGFPAGGR
ncbi:hypothetical protein FRC09_001887 [Ceratobasidium sp. 395]|nr:hypothetical protein FRC09_001887 [Ceratobasidium sp. 395]